MSVSHLGSRRPTCDRARPFRHVTINLKDWTGAPGRRWQLLRALMAELRPDVVSVQEIKADSAADRTAIFVALAAELGMNCHVPDGGGASTAAFEPGRRERGIGLMWDRDRVAPVPGSLRCFNKDPFYIGMVLAEFDVDCGAGSTVRIAIASSHLSPRCQFQRHDETTYVGTEVSGSGVRAIVGLDCNSPMGSRTKSGKFYDPDPYRHLAWGSTPEMIPRCRRERRRPWWRQVLGLPLRHWADREPMMRLEDAGLVDPAAVTNAPWFRTTGYWDEQSITKRNDGPFVTTMVAAAVVDIRALDTDIARQFSDHLPVVLDLCLDVLLRGAGHVCSAHLRRARAPHRRRGTATFRRLTTRGARWASPCSRLDAHLASLLGQRRGKNRDRAQGARV